MKGVLKDKLYAIDIGSPGIVQANLIISKLDEIITHNKVTTNQTTGEREDQVLHIIEDGFSSEENIMIFLEGDIYNDYCSATGESQYPFLMANTQESMIRDIMIQQLKNMKLTVSLHHGKLNPLPST